MGLFSWFRKPKIQKIKTDVVDGKKSAKKKLAGRAKDLSDAREFILREYNHITGGKRYTKDDNCVIYPKKNFTDIYEIINAYQLDKRKCVVVIPPPEDIDTKIFCPEDIAGVFDPHEKGRKIVFPDSISSNTVLFNVKAVDTDGNDISFIADTKLFNLSKLSKEGLIKVIFGFKQRLQNKSIEKYLLSLGVVEQDSVFFYLVTKASKKVKDKVFDFKDEYFSIKDKSFVPSRVYPSVPDEVHGGLFDWEKAEREAKDGVIIKHFHGSLFYDKLAENNLELKSILNAEKLRLKFLEKFPALEKAICESGWRTNSGYNLGQYSYVPYDRARYDNYHDYKIRGLDRSYSIWSSVLYDLEALYKDIKIEKYCNSINEQKQKKCKRESEIFNKIAGEMLYGIVSGDDEIISFMNMNSSKSISEQFNKGTTFSFVKPLVFDSQNKEINEELKVFIEKFIKDKLDEEFNSGCVSSIEYMLV